MKTTFLIYKDINAEKKELKVATHDEWDAIMKANKGLSAAQRRYFIRDCVEEADGLDSMFIGSVAKNLCQKAMSRTISLISIF